ncbi:MAG: cysteine--tRNA ligase [Candidatus Babeliales bacterium]
MMIVFNTLTGKKEPFVPQHEKSVTLYVCGVTPYDHAHIGHGRCYVTFDLLYRLLESLGYDVVYCRNFTDIDDKLLNKAQKLFGDKMRYLELANEYIASYNHDMAALNTVFPAFEPRVTENIPAIINFIEELVEAGKAYVVEGGDVYFNIQTFGEYGKLSKQKIDQLRAGERVEVNKLKKDPLDFALWKSEPKGEFWQSPWGWGRPGWHIECSVLAKEYLGTTLDIHAGGLDLAFPHHENEIAQSEGLHGVPFARYWMHNAFVRIDKEKMSKSLGNFIQLRALLKDYDPMVVRYYYIQHHYRAPLDFSYEELENARKVYTKLVKAFENVPMLGPSETTKKLVRSEPIIERMSAFLREDLNTSGMFGVLHEELKTILEQPKVASHVKHFMQHVLGLTMEPVKEKTVEITPEIQKLIDARAQARADKDWATSDKLRDQLAALGVDVQDKKL